MLSEHTVLVADLKGNREPKRHRTGSRVGKDEKVLGPGESLVIFQVGLVQLLDKVRRRRRTLDDRPERLDPGRLLVDDLGELGILLARGFLREGVRMKTRAWNDGDRQLDNFATADLLGRHRDLEVNAV